MKNTTLVILLLPLLLAGCHQPPPAPQNVVLICIDTVRADTFWAPEDTDRPDALSPWLARALQYRNAQSTASWTIPAVASVMTGYYPLQHKAGHFKQPVANLDVDIPSPLTRDADTVIEQLQQSGFDTAAFAAHPFIVSDYGLNQGFDLIEARQGWRGNVEAFADWLAGPRAESLQPNFLAYLHFMEAHDWHLDPIEGLEQRLAQLTDAERQWLESISSDAACTNRRMCLKNQVYALAVMEQRRAIAEILAMLERGQLLENTIVMVYSDHGEEFWEHRDEAIATQNDPRGYHGAGHGQSLYQELLEVPLLAWKPGTKGRVITGLASLVDIYPSILQWAAGIEVADGQRPGSVLPVKNRRRGEREVYASGIAYGPQMIAAREDNSKAIWDLTRDTTSYFDLKRDPAEKAPIRSDQLVFQFDGLFGDHLELPSLGQSEAPEISQSQLEHLKSIGYLQGLEAEDVAEGGDEENPPEQPENPEKDPRQPQ